MNTRCPPKRVPSSRPLFFHAVDSPCSHPRATASEDNAALWQLQASPQAPGQTTGVAGARFQMAGNGVRSCRAAGWDGTIPICENHKGCRSVQVENGHKTAGFVPVYNYGDFIAFACNSGYILHGTDTVTCGINEIWEPELPTCQKAPCGNPPIHPNAVLEGEPKGPFVDGFTITYKCQSGYVQKSGSPRITCTSSQWSHLTLVCEHHKGCPLVQVENGLKVAGFGPDYNYGDFITFACDSGYILHGTDTVTCGINEIWEPELPTCQKGLIYVILGLLIPVAVAVAVAVGFWFFKNRKGKSSSPPGTAAVY
ncbi:UNVERIFIED_CONTAM: hypothetical protein FKN15_057421 [Acipenser sinensis]